MSAADILLDLASARPYARAQVLAVPGLVDGLIADALALHKRSTKAAANGSGGGGGGGGDEKGWEGGDASTAVAAAASAAVDRRLMLLQRIMYGAELFLDVPAGLDQLITMLIATTQENNHHSVQCLGVLATLCRGNGAVQAMVRGGGWKVEGTTGR